ncbi:restriction endonuclease [Phenylobacterium sp. Root700]|uniref:restriction endonuclease n=1 Tax=Phenylobacterium sp. Root700 TaxID=1736591 RepID=UPI0006FB7D4F|nr:restriction endonuclease [Phenylobacterium sp. Root700]KRB42044.1 hypothetical protein ASE02_04330 [Phenylobacterium sp. Root700]
MAQRPKPKTKTPVDYVKKVRRLNWDGLEALWTKIQERNTKGWAAGKAFEHLILRAFELSDVDVTWPYDVKLADQIVEQIDGMVQRDGLAALIEAKDYDANLNVEPLAKLRNQLLRRPSGVVGCAFSSKGFTDPAKTLAQYMSPQAILLWQQPEIGHLLTNTRDFKAALKKKHYWLLRTGSPDYDTRTDALP